MYWRVALLVLLTTGVPQAKAEPPDEQEYPDVVRAIRGSPAGYSAGRRRLPYCTKSRY
jgi:hypothetical protein